ncbi:MAG TPA: site-specific integrase [Candidatus Mediterraneibacter pullistercoris]|nr:site-specific integrase [Candidatus Mediterraneibacter pullistercoris]
MTKNNYDFSKATVEQMFSFLVENGIINVGDTLNAMTKKHEENLLKKHPFDIWQGTDSRYRTYVEDESKPSGRRMIVKTYERDLLNYLIAFYEKQEQDKSIKNYTLERLYPEWKNYKSLHTTAETYITRINSDWNTYYKDTDIITIPIKDLTKLDLDEWAHKLIKDYNMTKNQYYNVTVIMRQALLYAVDLGIIESSPFSLVKIDGKRLFRKTKKKPDHTQVFFQSEIDEISRMALEDFYNRVKVYELAPLALLFQFQTGLRIGELCVVRYDDIETPDYIHIQRMLRRDTNEVVEHTKTSYGDRQIFLTAQAKHLIALAKERQESLSVDSSGYIFSINGKPLTERSVATLYVKYCKKAGIIQKSSHKSRKTYISALIDGKVNINTVREMVGHADERTTLGNYAFDRKTDSEKAQMIENALNAG